MSDQTTYIICPACDGSTKNSTGGKCGDCYGSGAQSLAKYMLNERLKQGDLGLLDAVGWRRNDEELVKLEDTMRQLVSNIQDGLEFDEINDLKMIIDKVIKDHSIQDIIQILKEGKKAIAEKYIHKIKGPIVIGKTMAAELAEKGIVIHPVGKPENNIWMNYDEWIAHGKYYSALGESHPAQYTDRFRNSALIDIKMSEKDYFSKLVYRPTFNTDEPVDYNKGKSGTRGASKDNKAAELRFQARQRKKKRKKKRRRK